MGAIARRTSLTSIGAIQMALANVCINLASRSSNEKRPGDRQPTPASNESQSLNIARSGRVSDNQRPRQALHATDSAKRTPSNKIRCLKQTHGARRPHKQKPCVTCNSAGHAIPHARRARKRKHASYAIPHALRPHNTRPTTSPQDMQSPTLGVLTTRGLRPAPRKRRSHTSCTETGCSRARCG